MKQGNIAAIRKVFGSSWAFNDNYSSAVNGRIWVCWNTSYVTFQPVCCTDQTVHGLVSDIAGTISFYITYVYGCNTGDARKGSWRELLRLSSTCIEAWVILGDFNSIVSPEDRLGGTLVTAAECIDFKEALFHTQLQELSYVGWEFTWCNKQPNNLI